MSYKTWPNYQTAIVYDWMAETPEMFSGMRKRLREVEFDFMAATVLKTTVHELVPDYQETGDEFLLLSFIRGGLSEVDWLELAHRVRQDS